MSMPSFVSIRAFGGRLLIALVLVSSLTVAGVAAVNRRIDEKISQIHRISLELAAPPPQGANYLLLGSDTRAFVKDAADAAEFGTGQAVEGQRSDTIMVAHVEPGAQKTLIVSFPRDLLVDIPGYGKSKINAAFDLGGPQLVIDTLQVNFPGLRINHYVQVDFRSFRAVVDAIGNVNVYFPKATRDFATDPRDGDTGFDSKRAGCVALDGEEALKYVRSRHLQELDGPTQRWNAIGADAPDIYRIQRQQMFIRQLAGIAVQRSLGDPTVAFDIADNVIGFLKMDQGVQRDDIDDLIRAFRTVDVNDPNSVDFRTLDYVVNPTSSVYGATLGPGPSAPSQIALLASFGDKAPPPRVVPSQVRVKVVDFSGRGVEQEVSEKLTEQGFVAAGVAGAKNELTTVDIHYGPHQADAAKLLLRYFPDARLLPNPAADDRVVIYLGSSFEHLVVPSLAEVPAPASAPADGEPAPSSSVPTPTVTTAPPGVLTLGSPC